MNEDRDRIRFLTGGRAGDPDTDALVRALAFHERPDHRLTQFLESLRVPEEAGHAHQHVTGQLFGFFRMLLDMAVVLLDALYLTDAHPSLDSAGYRRSLVVAKIGSMFAA